MYNLLSIAFSQPYKVEFRVYDDGVAYRISNLFKDSFIIKNELAEFCFPGKLFAYFPQEQKRSSADIFHIGFEEEYPLRKVDSFSEGTLGYSPILVVPESNPKIAITESDLDDYPDIFLRGTGSSRLIGVFADYPLEEQATKGVYSQFKVTKRAVYIARTSGTRSFPWRVLLIAAADKELPGNDIVYRLATPSRICDASWGKPDLLSTTDLVRVLLLSQFFGVYLSGKNLKEPQN